MKKGVHFLKLFSKPAEGLVDILEVVAQVTGLVIRKYPFLKTYIAVEYAADMLPSRECKNWAAIIPASFEYRLYTFTHSGGNMQNREDFFHDNSY